mgnify:CR=1 FL=1
MSTVMLAAGENLISASAALFIPCYFCVTYHIALRVNAIMGEWVGNTKVARAEEGSTGGD